MGYTDLLKEEGLSSREREGFIDVINRNGKALTRLIEDILDLSKVEAGKLVTENNHFSLRVLLSDVAFIFGDLAEKKGIHFITEIADYTPDFLITDSVRLRQILINIIGNAIKFTGSGYVKVKVRVEPQNYEDDHILLIEVEDSGIGLSSEEINRLFEPFVQADESTSRRYGGTGLGLALSRRLALALGGNITILKSNPGEGSSFLIAIHVGLAPDDRDDLRTEKSFHLHRDVLESVRILLVEDAPDNSLLISNMLGYYGAEVETASNGRDGVDMALAQYFDVVLMDIQMPLMDGYEAFQRLKSKNYQSPIIALTAHAMPEERKRTSQLGFVAHITKPIDPVELISCIHKFSYLHRSLQSINP
jgi:CheY-like chemotaxis protein